MAAVDVRGGVGGALAGPMSGSDIAAAAVSLARASTVLAGPGLRKARRQPKQAATWSGVVAAAKRDKNAVEKGFSQRKSAAHLSQTSRRSTTTRQVASPDVATVVEGEAPETFELRLKDDDSLAGATDDSAFCGDDGIALSPGLRPIQEGGATGKYWIHTFGCQMNLADSERMAGILETMGYRCTDDANEANVLVYNTCSIRDKAEHKVYSALGYQAARKHTDPHMKIIVAGCVAQQEGERLLRRVPEVDLVMGPQHANRLHELLEQVELGSQVCAIEPLHIVEDIARPRRDSAVTAWVNVIYGCNEKCTYCVVPSTRGSEQSREPEAIRRECLAVAEAGYKEITLLGQNIDAYGRDLPGFATDGSGRRLWTFTDLLYYVAEALQGTGVERLRFATSHPRYFTERLIRACADIPIVCKHFHVPFQSGDNDVLKAMLRGYTHESYRRIIDKIRHYMPDAAISADAIVGFPGETEEQFQRTVDLVNDVQFDIVNTAAYSPRPNTPAAEWETQVADLIKEDRLQRLNAACTVAANARSQRYLGREELILVEGVGKHPGQVIGRTDGNRLTYIQGGEDLIGRIVRTKITTVRSYSLTAELLEPVLR